MKKLFTILCIPSLIFLYSCETHVVTKKRVLDFNCSNDYQIRFQEETKITQSDTTTNISVVAKKGGTSKKYNLKQARAASGVRYVTADKEIVFWEHQGTFTLYKKEAPICVCQ